MAPGLTPLHPASVSNKILRQFAVLWILFLGVLACRAGFGRESWMLASILAGLGLSWGLAGLFSPEAIRPIFIGLTAISLPIGWVVSNIILLALFFGVVTPIGLIFRLVGRDALALRRQPGKESYWLPLAPVTDIKRYFRQS